MAYRFVEEDQPPQQKEGIISSALRNPTRVASKLATRAIGLPGDVLSLANQLVARPLTEKITGKQGLPYEETFLGKAIPTTEQHRKGLEKVGGEYLKPQNRVEEFVDDVIEDTALLFTPGGKVTKSALVTKTPMNFFKAIGANLGKEAVKDITGNETYGDLAKIGSLFALSLLDKPAATKQLSDLYKTAEAALPKNASTSANRLSSNLQNLENKVSRGRPKANLADSEKFVVDHIDKVKKLIQSGKINVQQAWAQKRSLNEDLMKKLYEIPDKAGQHRAKSLAKNINHYLSEAIGDYGKTNPSFYKPFKNAEEGFGTMARSNIMTRFVEKNLKYSPLTSGLLHAFGGNIGAGAAKSIIPYQVGKIGYRIAKSPTLRKHYLNTLKAAAKEDSAVFNKQLQKLDENLQEEEAKSRYRFVD